MGDGRKSARNNVSSDTSRCWLALARPVKPVFVHGTLVARPTSLSRHNKASILSTYILRATH
jgi:hypothetical protein